MKFPISKHKTGLSASVIHDSQRRRHHSSNTESNSLMYHFKKAIFLTPKMRNIGNFSFQSIQLVVAYFSYTINEWGDITTWNLNRTPWTIISVKRFLTQKCELLKIFVLTFNAGHSRLTNKFLSAWQVAVGFTFFETVFFKSWHHLINI